LAMLQGCLQILERHWTEMLCAWATAKLERKLEIVGVKATAGATAGGTVWVAHFALLDEMQDST